jgi:hypothetical protein
MPIELKGNLRLGRGFYGRFSACLQVVPVSCVIFLLSFTNGFGLNCAPLEPKGGANTDQSFQGKLNGKIDGLFAKFAGVQANTEGTYRAIQTDVLKEYPEASKNFIWERLIYLQCELLNSSRADDAQKDSQFKGLIEKINNGPPKDGASARTPLQTERQAVLITPGSSGAISANVVSFRIHASPAVPQKLKVYVPGAALAENWAISGVDFRQDTGLLAIYVTPDPPDSKIGTMTFFIAADGYDRQMATVSPSTTIVNDVFLTPQKAIKLERVTVLDTKDDTLAIDMIIANSSPEDRYIDKVSFANIGVSNNVCNPNPIVTFTYNLGLQIQGGVVSGSLSEPGDTASIPASGSSEHSYCDGYFAVSYQQEIKVPASSKISYVLKISSLSLKTTEVTPPTQAAWSTMDQICMAFKDCKPDSKNGNKCTFPKTFNIDTGKRIDVKSICSKWQPPTPDTYVIPRIGLPSNVLRIAAKAGKLDRATKPKEFLLNTEPYYGGPAWSDCFVILHTDDGAEEFGKYCESRFYTDERDVVINGFVRAGLSETMSEKLVLGQKRSIN